MNIGKTDCYGYMGSDCKNGETLANRQASENADHFFRFETGMRRNSVQRIIEKKQFIAIKSNTVLISGEWEEVDPEDSRNKKPRKYLAATNLST